jgi:hypothetical protein
MGTGPRRSRDRAITGPVNAAHFPSIPVGFPEVLNLLDTSTPQPGASEKLAAPDTPHRLASIRRRASDR